jgi:hypothetical protein
MSVAIRQLVIGASLGARLVGESGRLKGAPSEPPRLGRDQTGTTSVEAYRSICTSVYCSSRWLCGSSGIWSRCSGAVGIEGLLSGVALLLFMFNTGYLLTLGEMRGESI